MSRLRRGLLSFGALIIAVPLLGVGAVPAGFAQDTTTVPPTPAERAAALAEPSIVYLDVLLEYYLDTGYSGLGYLGPYQWTGSCTGEFVSSDGYIETAGHCVDLEPGSPLWDEAIVNGIAAELGDAPELTDEELTSVVQEALGLWKVEGAAAGSDAQLTVTVAAALGVSGQQAAATKTARIVEVKSFEDGDVALLKTEETNAPVLQLGSDADVNIGTPVLSIGYPGAEDEIVDADLSPTFKDGQINSKGTTGGVRVPVYQTSASLAPGMSGGPTVSLEGRLVGVNSFGSTELEDWNFISPVSLVQEQLARNDVSNELGPVDIAYRAGLDAFYAGDYAQAISEFDTVLGITPGHLYAQQFRQEANERLASAPSTAPDDDGGSSTLLIVGVVALLLVVLAIVVAIVMGRRRKEGAPTPPPAAPAAGAGPPSVQSPPPAPPPPAPPPEPPAASAPAPPAASVATAPSPPAPEAPTGAAPEAETVAFCSGCGRHVEPGERFCPACGHDLHSHG
jgi:serine protease Do